MHSQGMRARVRDLYFVQGMGMRTIGAMPGMPTRRTVRLWVCADPVTSGLAAIRGVVYAGGQIGAVRVFALTGVRCRIGGLLTVERVRVGQRSSRGRWRWIGHGMGRRRARRRRCGGAAPAGGGPVVGERGDGGDDQGFKSR